MQPVAPFRFDSPQIVPTVLRNPFREFVGQLSRDGFEFVLSVPRHLHFVIDSRRRFGGVATVKLAGAMINTCG